MIIDDARTHGREAAAIDELKAELGATSSDRLAAQSPARHAAAVRAPILLVHGDKDTVVLASQSQLMADRLKAAGKPHELVILEGENHYLTKTSNRTRTLEVLEQFLAKNLPTN